MDDGSAQWPDISVRKRLAAAKAKEHESLHSHRWIASLTDPELTPQRYRLVLSAYLQFFTAIEGLRLRMEAFPHLSLQRAIDALLQDTQNTAVQPFYCGGRVVEHAAMSCDALIGALYVVHGAGFGARTLAPAVRAALPEAGCAYLESATAPSLWRALVADLECLAQSRARQAVVIDSAAATFAEFGRFVARYCDSREGCWQTDFR